jgi:hypothetical protein
MQNPENAMTKFDAFAHLRSLAESRGGFFQDLTNHVLAYLPGTGRRLVVTFDNLISAKTPGNRMPWGQEYLASQGWNVLGVMVKESDWFRQDDLFDLLEELRDAGFFAQFSAVTFYGASMGGYGAATFAALAPGCTVVAFAPQSSLNTEITPFETRYRYARSRTDWTGRYADAAVGIRAAARAYILYDPMEPTDSAHVARLIGPNVTLLPMWHSGHKLPPALMRMNILKPVITPAIEGQLTPETFHQLHRARRQSVPWLTGLLTSAEKRGHYTLGLRLADRLLAETPHPKLKAARRALRDAKLAARRRAHRTALRAARRNAASATTENAPLGG